MNDSELSLAHTIVECATSIRGEKARKDFLDRLTQMLGYENYVFATFRKCRSVIWPSLNIINGYPLEWRERYDALQYANQDPAVALCSEVNFPFNWCDISELVSRKSCIKPRFEILDEAKEFGLNTGWTVPIHGAAGEWSLFSVAARHSTGQLLTAADANARLLYMIALLVHQSVIADDCILNDLPHRHDTPTDRERDVIAWAAEGKTISDTSSILGISESTVRFHLNNAMKKLEASNKTNAVAKALIRRWF